MRWLVCLLLLTAACQRTPVSNTPSPPTKSPDADEPITCAQDADCGHLSCGPCQSGQVVTTLVIRVSCAVNPCPGTKAVCRNRVCVVQ